MLKYLSKTTTQYKRKDYLTQRVLCVGYYNVNIRLSHQKSNANTTTVDSAKLYIAGVP